MKVSVLKIKIADKYFVIEMSKVKHFFEVENVLKIPSLPSFVEGIVKYNQYIYPLISLKKEWGLQETYPSTAVVVIYKGKEYAILIDEVIKIEKLEKKTNAFIEVFQEEGHFISHLNLNFLQDLNIPTFNNHNKKSIINTSLKSNFLLFKCNDEIIGIDTNLVKKVEDKKDNIFSLNNAVLEVIPFENIYKKCEYNSVLILEDEKVLALGVDEIIDICFIENDNITLSENGRFDKYFVYNKKEVKILSNKYLKYMIAKYGMHIPKEVKKTISSKIEVLLLNICNRDFAVRMQNVIDIDEYNTSSLQVLDTNPYIKGLITTKEGLTYIISYEDELGCKIKQSEDNKIIILKDDNLLKAVLVDEIKDIVYVNKENIIEAKNNDNIIGGMVIIDDNMIPLINIYYPNNLKG